MGGKGHRALLRFRVLYILMFLRNYDVSDRKQILIDQRADSRSKKNDNPAACGTKTTFTER